MEAGTDLFGNGDTSEAKARFYRTCEGAAADCGLEVYDLDYPEGNSTLRVFIFDPETETATLDDCVRMDRALTPVLEGDGTVPDNVVLEVSSPGVYRRLSRREHFESALGKGVALVLKTGEKITGRLDAVERDSVRLSGGDSLGWEMIKRANLEPESATEETKS